jgi:hypothetical protein
MALDPTISLQAGQGVTPIMQPMDVAAKGMALQGGMLQMQAQKMQNQQLQQQIQDAQDFRNTFKTAIANGQDPVQALSKSPSPIAQKYLSTILDMRQKGVKLEGDQYDLGIKKTQGMGNDILAATSGPNATPQSVAAVVRRHAASGDLPPAQAQEMLTELQSLQGPDALKNWGILQGLKTHVAKDVLGLFTPKTTIQGQNLIKQDPLTGDVTGAAPINGLRPEITGVHADPGNNAFGVDKYGNAVPILDANGRPQKMRPPTSMLMMQGGTNALTPEAKQMLVQKYIQTGQLDSDLSARMPGLRNEIINLAAAQTAGGAAPNLAGAKQQFASAQAAQKYFTTGKGADAFRQQETILHHAAVFSQIADALNNGNVQLANKLGNQFGAQFGSDQATNFKIAGQIFSNEVGKYLAGSQSTAEERKELSDLIPSFSSPQQIKGGLATLSNLVQGQRQSWLAQRDAALKGQVAFGGPQGAPQPAPQPKVMTLADAKATAAASGKTLDQVVQAAKAKGWRIQ